MMWAKQIVLECDSVFSFLFVKSDIQFSHIVEDSPDNWENDLFLFRRVRAYFKNHVIRLVNGFFKNYNVAACKGNCWEVEHSQQRFLFGVDVKYDVSSNSLEGSRTG